MKKTNYQITIGYKAIVCVHVKAETEKEVKEIALEKFKDKKDKIYKSEIELQDDNFKVDGILDIDASWNML